MFYDLQHVGVQSWKHSARLKRGLQLNQISSEVPRAEDDVSSFHQALQIHQLLQPAILIPMSVPREIDLFKSLQFKHKSLVLEGDEIRLVELLAPKTGTKPELQHLQPIECRIVHVKLSECPKYEALSYEWGQPSHTHQILIDSQPFLVRPNLYAALKLLRDPIRQTVLWIDALCINQDDARERNHQVAQVRSSLKQSQLEKFALVISRSMRQ